MSSRYDRMMVPGLVSIVTMFFMLIRKRIGESGDPCRVPLSVLKYREVLALNR